MASTSTAEKLLKLVGVCVCVCGGRECIDPIISSYIILAYKSRNSTVSQHKHTYTEHSITVDITLSCEMAHKIYSDFENLPNNNRM